MRAWPRASRRRPTLRPAWRRLAVIVVVLVAIAGAVGLLSPAARADTLTLVPWREPSTPPLALMDRDGRSRTLADYRGTVVLLNFWATWCEPCRAEMPSMQRLKERLAGRPFAVLAVNYGESDRRIAEFLEPLALDLTVLLDPGQSASRAWRVRVLPTSFLVGADGRVRYSVVGQVDWAAPPIAAAVRGLLP